MSDPLIAPAILGSSAISAGAGLCGSKSQAKAAKQAMDLQWQMYQQQRTDSLPWLEAGRNAVAELEKKVMAGIAGPGDYEKTPDYQFRKDVGNRALAGKYAARGALGSGAYAKALARYNQDYATTDYNNFINRELTKLTPLQSLSGMGMTMANQQGQMGQQLANNVGDLGMQGANARASGYANVANSARSGLQDYLFANALGGNSAFNASSLGANVSNAAGQYALPGSDNYNW